MKRNSLHGRATRLAAVIALIGSGLMLSACVNNTPLDDLEYADPAGVTPFDEALYRNYAFLARSFGEVGTAAQSVFDFSGSMSLNDTDHSLADLANAFAAKAVAASNGTFVDPEPARNPEAHAMRDRLVRALEPGREAFPRDAARAQADYDCWMLNLGVATQKAAAQQCRQSFDSTLALLETDTKIAPPAAEPSEPAVAAPVATPAQAQNAALPPGAQPAEAAASVYAVYFDFASWTLTAEQLQVLDQAVAQAKSGKTVRLRIVGHTDTSGPADFNMSLSVKRANVVKAALVDMGVRRSAIRTSGVGETDLAIETGDDVREPKNRRAVISVTQ